MKKTEVVVITGASAGVGRAAVLEFARHGASQYDGAEDPNRPANLWNPVPGDHGAHGTIDTRSRTHSLELWAESHRKWLAGAAGLIGLMVLGTRLRPRSRRTLFSGLGSRKAA